MNRLRIKQAFFFTGRPTRVCQGAGRNGVFEGFIFAVDQKTMKQKAKNLNVNLQGYPFKFSPKPRKKIKW